MNKLHQGEMEGEERVVSALALGISLMKMEGAAAFVLFRTRHARNMSVALIPQAI